MVGTGIDDNYFVKYISIQIDSDVPDLLSHKSPIHCEVQRHVNGLFGSEGSTHVPEFLHGLSLGSDGHFVRAENIIVNAHHYLCILKVCYESLNRQNVRI